MSFRTKMFMASVLGLLMLAATGVVQAQVKLPGPLVTPQWLHEHADDVQIVDLRDDLNSLTEKPRYRNFNGKKVLVMSGGHIPFALSVNVAGLREPAKIDGKTVNYMRPSMQDFQGLMRATQLENGKPIVLVPTGDNVISLQEAALLAFELQVYGEPADNIAILNGGMHAWIEAGYEVDTDAIAPLDQGTWTATRPNTGILADVAQVKAAQRTPGRLVDARPLAQFAGLDNTPVIPVAGRIKGARSLPTELLYKRAADGSWHFLSADEYRSVLKTQGIGDLSGSILYCNTGQYASGAYYALAHIMGVKGVREFQGGMNEWLHRGLPAVDLDGNMQRMK